MSDTSIQQSNLVTKGFRSTAVNTTASPTGRQIKTGDGTVKRILVNSHTTGTFRFYEGTATSLSAIGGTYTPATGSSEIEIEAAFNSGIFMSAAGTLDATVIYE